MSPGPSEVSGAQKLFNDVASWNFNSVGYALVRKDAMERAWKTAAM